MLFLIVENSTSETGHIHSSTAVIISTVIEDDQFFVYASGVLDCFAVMYLYQNIFAK